MDVTDGTDLAAMHTAIVTASAAAFNGVHFEFYREDRKNLPFGAGGTGQDPTAYVLLDLTGMDAAGDDPGTEQQAMEARFEAEVVVKSLQANSKTLVRVLAANYAAFLRRQLRWPGVLNGPIQVTGAYKDDFEPELDKYEVWRVEWTQTVFLGAGVPWTPPAGDVQADAANITTPLFSYVPLVGIPYEAEYQPVIPLALP